MRNRNRTTTTDTESPTEVASTEKRRAAAFQEHSSQGPVMETSRVLFEKYGHEEFYTLVAAEGVNEARLTDDLFEGLK